MYTNTRHLSTLHCMDLSVNVWLVNLKYLQMTKKTAFDYYIIIMHAAFMTLILIKTYFICTFNHSFFKTACQLKKGTKNGSKPKMLIVRQVTQFIHNTILNMLYSLSFSVYIILYYIIIYSCSV